MACMISHRSLLALVLGIALAFPLSASAQSKSAETAAGSELHFDTLASYEDYLIDLNNCGDLSDEAAIDLLGEATLLATGACSKKKATIGEISFYYCSGRCSAGKTCTANYDNGRLKSCTCKPTPQPSLSAPADGSYALE